MNADHEFEVLDDGKSIGYGPTRFGEEWELHFATEDGERVEVRINEPAMYELWTEVHNVPWSAEDDEERRRRGTLTRSIVERVQTMDEEGLEAVKETIDGIEGGEPR